MGKRTLRIRRPLPCMVLLGLQGATLAETSTSFQVSASVVPGCAVDGLGTQGNAGFMGRLDFGEALAMATSTHEASLAAAQAITLRCTPGTALTVSVGGGQQSSGGLRYLRHASAPDQRLAYRLYRDAGFTQEMAVDQDYSISVTMLNANDVRIPVHGRLTLPGGSAPGVYNDTLVVTLRW
jgi:spore coat protein U-like protein